MQHSHGILEAPPRAGVALTLVVRGKERGSAGSIDSSLGTYPKRAVPRTGLGTCPGSGAAAPLYAGLSLKGPCTITII